MPEKVSVWYNDGSSSEEAVVWEEAAVAAIDTGKIGKYDVRGTVTVSRELETPASLDVICTVTVAFDNLLRNPGFEEEDMSMWEISSDVISRKNDMNNVHGGEWTLHFWSDSDMEYTVSQKIKLPAGSYTFGGYLEGGDAGDGAAFSIGLKAEGKEYSAQTMVSRWQEWKNPEIKDITLSEDMEVTVELKGKAAAKGWGAWDDLYLYRQ